MAAFIILVGALLVCCLLYLMASSLALTSSGGFLLSVFSRAFSDQNWRRESDTRWIAGARSRASFRVGPPWGSHLV